jgi:hypothetical protein
MIFQLKIQLGNAEMDTPEHVAAALRRVAEKLDAGFTYGPIADVNGNTVGSYDLAGS